MPPSTLPTTSRQRELLARLVAALAMLDRKIRFVGDLGQIGTGRSPPGLHALFYHEGLKRFIAGYVGGDSRLDERRMLRGCTAVDEEVCRGGYPATIGLQVVLTPLKVRVRYALRTLEKPAPSEEVERLVSVHQTLPHPAEVRARLVLQGATPSVHS